MAIDYLLCFNCWLYPLLFDLLPPLNLTPNRKGADGLWLLVLLMIVLGDLHVYDLSIEMHFTLLVTSRDY